MNNISPFVRKIIYLACIGGLLIPISQISRPETREEDGSIRDHGGHLSVLRESYDLSQAKMSDIDPASETMKLASLGLRGVAVNILWMQALDHQDKENWDQFASTLQSLIKIQPNFVKVWDFQAHNLAYNVSMEFDDYEYRYHWVKKGISFLKQGIPYNKRDHRVTDKLGFYTGNKFGKSDEQISFRRLFRKDSEFHEDMSFYIEPDLYHQRGFGFDSWKMAWHWYDYSRMLVEEKSCPPHSPDMMRFMLRPSQVRNQALSLQTENRTNEIIQEVWRDAFDQWNQYGNQEISNTLGVTITLEGLATREVQRDSWREKLDQLVPDGTRSGMVNDLLNSTDLTEDQKRILDIPISERNDKQMLDARRVNQLLARFDGKIDAAVALSAPVENRFEANKIVREIELLQKEIRTINKDSDTVNYRYWRARNQAESENETVKAQQELYDAREKWRQSIYDDEYDFDYKTKTKTNTQKGAINSYLEAFELWAQVLEKHPDLKSGSLADELTVAMQEYLRMLVSTNREWPENFPLQALIDQRFREKSQDGLPTSDDVAELRSSREMEKTPEVEPSDPTPKTEASQGDKTEDAPKEDAPKNDASTQEPAPSGEPANPDRPEGSGGNLKQAI